jgi:tetratricopeptide (TPR) repeat protein
VNPQAARIRIDEAEENLRTGRVPKEKQADAIVKLADEYTQLSQNEKALEYLGRVLRSKNSPDAIILNKMAMICGTMGDAGREEKLYLEAARNTTWGGPWFNLALAQRRRKKFTEARESIDKAIAADDDGSSYTLKAMIEESLGNAKARTDALAQAMTKFKPVASMIDWELGWYLTAARMAGKSVKEEDALAEQRRRRVAGNAADLGGVLPILDPTPARR